MQQEQVDEQMLSTGNVPQLDAVHKMPTPSHAEREYTHWDLEKVNGANIQKLYPARRWPWRMMRRLSF
jgi:hypothetical protein